MTDLDEKEQSHVRVALRHIRRVVGAWAPIADALHYSLAAVEKTINGRCAVSPRMAFRVARLAGLSLDDLLAGRCLPGACCRCGHLPDFGDEPTTVEDAPRPVPFGGLKLLK